MFTHSLWFGRRSILIALLALAIVVVSASTVDAAGGRRFYTTLTGAAEAPGPGDPDGSGTATITLNQGRGKVCFTIAVDDIALPATGAHIHKAPVGQPGPVAVALVAPDGDGTSSGCVDADRDLIKAIRKNPENYYVNVHTTEYPAGAVRGQLD